MEKQIIMKSHWLEDAPHFSFHVIHSFLVVASFKAASVVP